MTRNFHRLLASLCFATLCALALTPRAALSQASVLTFHNDNARTGQNLQETTLAPSNVTASTFGKLYARALDGLVYAQPLYVSNVTIPGKGVHDVVYVATEHDTVYAFDAHSNAGANAAPLWQTSFINPAAGVTTLRTGSSPAGYSLYPEMGITGTPVIDPATNTLYVVAFTQEVSGGVTNYVMKLHALDITTGQENAPFPTALGGSVAGTATGSVNGQLAFIPYNELQRTPLVLSKGTIYVGISARTGNRHGWLFSFGALGSAQPGGQTGIFCTSPNTSLNALWGSGAGLAADANGNIWTITGNGNFDVNKTTHTEWGEAVLKISTTGSIAVADYFVPSNFAALDQVDADFGAGAALLLPDSYGSALHPHLIVACGKEGTIYLLDRDNLGKYNASQNQVLQQLPGAVSGAWSIAACWSSPTTNYVYYSTGGDYRDVSGDVMKAFSVTNGMVSTSPVSQAATQFRFPGASPSVSSNGTASGIVWAVQGDGYSSAGPAILHAYDATNVATELYNSSQMGARDKAAVACKFAVPTIANGNVYFGTQSTLEVYGLLATAPPTIATAASATPNPVTGTTTALSVLGADDGGEAALTYTWATTGTPPAPVAFSANGTNTAKNATATFTKAGTYSFTVTATDGNGQTVTSSVTVVVNQTPTTLTVTPATATVATGATQQFTASETDQFGAAIASAVPAWTVDTGGVGTVDPISGLYSAGAAGGTATVRAAADGLSGTAAVTVTAPANPPTIATAASATPNPVTGTGTALSVLGADDAGEANLTYTWVATGPAAVTYSDNGTNTAKNTAVTFTKAGTYSFTVTIADAATLTATSTVSVVVNQTLTTLSVSPGTASVARNGTQTFTAAGTDQFGTALSPAPAVTWSVDAGGVGTVDASNGVYTAGATLGSATVHATSGGVSGTAGVTVTNAAPTIATAASATPNPVTGTGTALSVLGADDAGEANLTYTWVATGPAAVTYSDNGTNTAKNTAVTFTKAGTYSFTVTIADADGLSTTSTTTVSVSQTPTTVAVSPATASVTAGTTKQFAASVTDQFGVVISPAPAVTWTVSGGGTVSTSGLFNAGSAAGGPFTVSAKTGVATGTAAVTVTAAATGTTLTPTADAYVRASTSANTNFGSIPTLIIQRAVAGGSGLNNKCAYLRFDLTKVTKSPTSAKLNLTLNANSQPATATETVTMYGASDGGWQEGTITWNNAPSLNRTAFSSTASKITSASVKLVAGNVLTFDITSYVKSHLGKVVTLQLINLAADGNPLVADSREGANGPKLVLQ